MTRGRAWSGIAAILGVSVWAASALAQGCPIDWTFTYQGELKNSGAPVTGTADFTFKLFNLTVGGVQVGPTITMNGLAVADGVFTADLDFTNGGVIPGVFDGCKRYMEVTVNGTLLTPRQDITRATPHAATADLLHMPYAEATVVDGAYAFTLQNDGHGGTIHASATQSDSGLVAIFGETTASNTFGIGVYGLSNSTTGAGVAGSNQSGSGWGVFGQVEGPAGAGVAAIYGHATGTGSALSATCLSPNGWAGSFQGRGYFTDKLGIGVQGPAAMLDVQGGDTGGQALLVNDDLYVNTTGFVGVGRSTAVTTQEVFGVNSSATSQGAYGGMYVSTDGATSRPFYGYAAGGNADAWTYYDGTTAQWRVNLSNVDRLTLDPVNGFGVKRAAAANDFEVEGTASKTTSGSWLANSDRRIKTDVRTVADALATLDRVRLVDFRYTDAYRAEHESIGDRRYHNVIAQEFAQVFPDYVKPSGEKLPNGDDILQVDTYPLTIYSAAAVQELHTMLQAKDAEIASLQGRLAKVEAALADLASGTAPLGGTLQNAVSIGGK